MSKTVNSLTLVGNVGQDPEIRATSSGSKMAQFSIATTDGWGDNEKTNWHRVKVFGRLAPVVEEFVRKGDRLYIRGRVDYSTSESDQGTRYWTDVIVDDLVMLGSPGATIAQPEDAADKPLPF